MENSYPAGIIMSRAEGEAVQEVINGAHKAGYMDAKTWAEMTTDRVRRTVPQ